MDGNSFSRTNNYTGQAMLLPKVEYERPDRNESQLRHRNQPIVPTTISLPMTKTLSRDNTVVSG